MRLTFWGTRGSIPVPGLATAGYGGNTPCIAVEEQEHLLVLDAGTGIRALGLSLAARGYRGPVDLLLSHAHSDHVHGLPFFLPIHDSGAPVRIFGPAPGPPGLHATLGRLMTPPYWPEHYAPVATRLDVTEITAETVETGYFRVAATPLRHPGRTLGFAVSAPGSGTKVNYMTDNELGEWTGSSEWQSRLVGFLRNSEVLIHDATYGEDEIRDRRGWGHSSASEAVELALAAGVRKLILFHHAPEHDDAAIDRLLEEARRRVQVRAGSLSVEAAREGEYLDL